jgi:molybdate/tungstate transport system substrate-binding protein
VNGEPDAPFPKDAVNHRRRLLAWARVVAVLVCVGGCRRGTPPAGVIVVYNAGSLARPLRAALDSFAAGHHVQVQQENAGSLETARKLTELGRVPDVVALADYEVFPRLLMPAHVTWYAQFARNRMVLAYTARSRGAGEISSTNWWRVVQGPGIQMAYSDPNLDPAGYRTLLLFQLAESDTREPGLANRLRAAVPLRNIRPKSADLVALLQAGELDYAWEYESVAQAASLRYVRVSPAIDLGDPARASGYAAAQVRVVGRTPGDSITFRGEPILYGLSIPRAAPHRQLAEQFVAFLLSSRGQGILRAAQLDALATPVVVGAGVPAAVLQALPADGPK